MPAEASSFSDLSWTRRLEQDILNLIRKEKLVKPVIVAEREPGSVAATELALEHPEQVGGVILAASNLMQFFSSPKDPSRKTPLPFADRVLNIDQGLGAKWFKYVTPETWKSNDMRPEMLSGDNEKGLRAWDEIESTPLPINIRYLCEYWASDVTRGFDKLRVPILALVPQFDEKFLADPANAFLKISYVDPWAEGAPKNPNIEIVKIPNARLLVLDEQPRQVDDAVALFVQRLR
jgi:pimeloyl-ACP methyl ester carboxylesterase